MNFLFIGVVWIAGTDSFQLCSPTTPFYRHHLTYGIPSSSNIIATRGTISSVSSSRRWVVRLGRFINKGPVDSRSHGTRRNSKDPLLIDTEHNVKSSCSESVQDRRKILNKILASCSTAVTTAPSFILWSTQVEQASAAASTTNYVTDTSVLDKMASKFSRVPAFALVDGQTGTPFMILKNSGVATAYFFTTYDGAQEVLATAKKGAEDQDLASKEMWRDARISAVSLEFALKLAKGRPKAMAQNGVKYSTVYDIISNPNDLNDASLIDGSGVYAEQGRVPLFYMKEFETGPEKEGGDNRVPVFLNKQDLLLQYAKKFPNVPPPPVQVFDLVDAFDTMLNPEFAGGGRKGQGNFIDPRLLMNLLPIPSVEVRKKAVEVDKERGGTSPYKLGEMVAVGGT